MFIVFKKKQMIITALVLMLGISGYLNYRYDKDNTARIAKVAEVNKDEPEIGQTVMVSTTAEEKTKEAKEAKEEKEDISNDSFALQKHERDAAREKTKEQLNELLMSGNISAEIRDETQRKLSDIARFEEAEVTAQNLLKAKGYENTMVYICEDSVTVTIKQSAISRSDTARIVDVIFELTQNNNVKIVEVE